MIINSPWLHIFSPKNLYNSLLLDRLWSKSLNSSLGEFWWRNPIRHNLSWWGQSGPFSSRIISLHFDQFWVELFPFSSSSALLSYWLLACHDCSLMRSLDGDFTPCIFHTGSERKKHPTQLPLSDNLNQQSIAIQKWLLLDLACRYRLLLPFDSLGSDSIRIGRSCSRKPRPSMEHFAKDDYLFACW